MRLTKDMKLTVIMGMVGQAAKKQAPAVNKEVKKIAKQWGDLARKYAGLYLPEVSPARWPEMIQDGLCYAMSTPDVTLNKSEDPEKPSYYKDDLGYLTLSYKGQGEEAAHEMVRSALRQAGWSGVLDTMTLTCYESYCRVKWSVRDASVIRLNFLNIVDVRNLDSDDRLVKAWTEEGLELAARTTELSRKFLEVLKQARAYYSELEVIMDSVSTDTALGKLFPEALAHLPRPEPKNIQQLAPQELVDNARKKLLTGIPD